MFDLVHSADDDLDALRRGGGGSLTYRTVKRAGDIFGALCLLPVVILTCLVLLVLNPFLNRGPLFFVQDRMGQGCRSFRAIKFRTMLPAKQIARGPYDALERNRITPLGAFLRKTRLDEVPQSLNVLWGDMSLIGPRPDFLDHALTYLDAVPGYRERHLVRPGISGLAQVTVGYVDSLDAVRSKVAADLYYIRNASLWLDLRIAWATLVVVLTRRGT